jgi:hypothetical protein
MIPSKYLFPVIALVLVWAGSLFAVYNYSSSETNRPSQTILMNALNEELHDNSNERVHDLATRLEERYKEKFRPTLPVLYFIQEKSSDIETSINQFKRKVTKGKVDFSETNEALKTLQEDMLKEMAIAKDSVGRLIINRHQEFDLNEIDVQHWLLNGNEELDLVSQMVSDLGAADNPDETLEQLATLKVINQLWLNQLSKSLVRVSGGRLIQCFIRYEVTPGQANLLKQRKKEQSLALDIIEYGTGLSYEDVKLVINSDTIASENGRFRTSVPTVKKGRHLIEAEILITNPLTGLATTRKSYFSYYVE